MSVEPLKEWSCACGAVEVQRGARAAEMLPTPPYEWAHITLTTTLPARTVGVGIEKVKAGETRRATQHTYCPRCYTTLLTAMYQLESHPASPSDPTITPGAVPQQ